jgi:hypothetical protein
LKKIEVVTHWCDVVGCARWSVVDGVLMLKMEVEVEVEVEEGVVVVRYVVGCRRKLVGGKKPL